MKETLVELVSVTASSEVTWNIVAKTSEGRSLFLADLRQHNKPELHHIADYFVQFPLSFTELPANTMIQKWADARPDYNTLTEFLEWLNQQEEYRERRVIDIHSEQIVDLYLGIDRVQLDNERAAMISALS